MEDLINTTGIRTTDFIHGRKGKFRVIVKCRAGFLVVADCLSPYLDTDPSRALVGYKARALQTVEFLPEGEKYWLTVFARTGKNIRFIDESFLRGMTVGDINQTFPNTTLHNHKQYEAVGATTWADYAFIKKAA